MGTYDYGTDLQNGNFMESVIVGSYDYGTDLQNGGFQEEVLT